MEKVNIKFHDNYTVTYQHKKILQFVPELSIDRNLRVMTPNIPLLVSAANVFSSSSKTNPFFSNRIYYCTHADAINADK